MLPPSYFDIAAEDLLDLYGQLEQSILQDVVRRLVKTGGMTDMAIWQTQRLQDSGMLMQDIILKVASMSNSSDAQIQAIFEDAGVQAMQYDLAIYDAAGLTPIPLRQSPAASQVLQAGIQKTSGHLRNLTLTTASTAQQAYIQAATLAEMQVESGAFDYVTAIRNSVRNTAQAGSTVLYPTGHQDHLDVAIRRATLTGMGQTTAQLSLRYMDDMGCDLVETTAHPGARPSHQVWQGKIFSRSGKKERYPDFATATGYGTGAGLCGWNCRHSFFPYFEGLSASAYPRTKLQEYEDKTVEYNGQTLKYYDATQKQRSMEREIRATKRELAGYNEGMKSDDEKIRNEMREDFDTASVKLKRQEAKLKNFAQQTGLDRQREREQVLGFGRSPAQKAVHSAKRSGFTGNFPIKKISKEKVISTTPTVNINMGHLNKYLSSEQMVAIRGKIEMAPPEFHTVWNKFADKINIQPIDDGGSFYAPMSREVSINPYEILTGKGVHKPLTTFFHESAHAIDNVSQDGLDWKLSKNKRYRYYTDTEIGRQFNQSIVDEAKEAIKNAGSPKAMREKLRAIPLENQDVSDIFEGATNAQVYGNVGHGSAAYWKIQGGVAGEAWAEMFSSTLVNPESLAQIKEYFPKSYSLFLDMIKGLAE